MPPAASGPLAWHGRPSSTPITERRLRVMHVVPSLDPGGTERLVIEISKGLMADVKPVV